MSIQVVTILLVEKAYFSKPELEHWHIRFEGITTHTKHKSNYASIHPQKHVVLSERGNTFLTTEEVIEEALNANESPAEMQAWADMIHLKQ